VLESERFSVLGDQSHATYSIPRQNNDLIFPNNLLKCVKNYVLKDLSLGAGRLWATARPARRPVSEELGRLETGDNE
jgi:hypothetical protein